MKQLLFLLFALLSYTLSYSQDKSDRLYLGEKQAKSELQLALSQQKQHNVVDNKTLLIKNKDTAIKIAESILFDIYGKENILKQQPYESYLIENHWVISGTLQKGYVGGTFLIIMDALNGKVIKITHGK
jgi:hypothetical protein